MNSANEAKLNRDQFKKVTIGYFIPEFPGQTHNFFWRERKALFQTNINTNLISTRLPPKGSLSPSWANQAKRETFYLLPFSATDIISALITFFKSGITSWINCFKIILRANDSHIYEKFKLILSILLAAKLVGHLKKCDITHIHVHSCGNCANIALFARFLSNISYSLTLHNPLSTFGSNQHQKWQYASFAIVITKNLHNDINKNLKNYLPPIIRIAPMGIDTQKFIRKAPYHPHITGTPLRIFSCARLNPCKGFVTLLKAIALLINSYTIKLIIAGEDDQGGCGYRKNLESQIHLLGLEENVILLGSIDEEEVIKQLERAHLFVLASIQEPLGVALMESMALEVPTIATDAGGVPELIKNNVDGILVPPNEPEYLADAIHALASNPKIATQLSRASRYKIIQSFTNELSARAIAESLELISASSLTPR